MNTALVILLVDLDNLKREYYGDSKYPGTSNCIFKRYRHLFPKTRRMNLRSPEEKQEVFCWGQEKVIDLSELVQARGKHKVSALAFLDEKHNPGIGDRVKALAFKIKLTEHGLAERSGFYVVAAEAELPFESKNEERPSTAKRPPPKERLRKFGLTRSSQKAVRAA